MTDCYWLIFYFLDSFYFIWINVFVYSVENILMSQKNYQVESGKYWRRNCSCSCSCSSTLIITVELCIYIWRCTVILCWKQIHCNDSTDFLQHPFLVWDLMLLLLFQIHNLLHSCIYKNPNMMHVLCIVYFQSVCNNIIYYTIIIYWIWYIS